MMPKLWTKRFQRNPHKNYDVHCLLSIIFGTKRRCRGEMWLNKHTQRPNYSNPPAHARWGKCQCLYMLYTVQTWAAVLLSFSKPPSSLSMFLISSPCFLWSRDWYRLIYTYVNTHAGRRMTIQCIIHYTGKRIISIELYLAIFQNIEY